MMVQHDVQHGADPFLRCSFFLNGFFHGDFPGAPLKFADLLLMSSVTFLWLHGSNLQVRLFILSVCLCV